MVADALDRICMHNSYLGTPLKEKLAGGYPTEMTDLENFGVGEALIFRGPVVPWSMLLGCVQQNV